MAPDEDPDTAAQQMKREAARLIRRLDENPDDERAIRDVETFVARGDKERDVFDRMARALNVTQNQLRKPGKKPLIIALCAILGASAFYYEDVRLRLMADHISQSAPQDISLPGDDRATLDAATALADSSDAVTREFTVLDGAAYFTVSADPRPFVIRSGALAVTALSTEFEVSRLEDDVLVAVFEGAVEVRTSDAVWTLEEGDRLMWSGGEARIDAVDLTEVAGWRDGEIAIDGMTFGQVAEMIDRRMPEKIVVPNAALSETRVSGRLDLSRPGDALQTLSTIADLSLWRMPYVVTIVGN